MKILVKENNKRKICLHVPLTLFLNLYNYMPFEGNKYDKYTIKTTLKLLKDYKKEFGSFVIVEVQDAEGGHVLITV